MICIDPIDPRAELCDVKYAKQYSNEGFRLLAAAVVKQAAKDKAKSFFFSPQFELFMPNYNGEKFWEQIEENYISKGKWFSDKEFTKEESYE